MYDMHVDNHKEEFARQYVGELCGVLNALPFEWLARALETLELALIEGRHVFIVGHGGSAATASHMANDLMKTLEKRSGTSMRAIALTDNVPIITAIANDVDYAEIFSGQLTTLGGPGDVLVAISASGNSPNILRAIDVAREIGMRSIALLGMNGGDAAKRADISVVVPSDDYGPIEDVHAMFNHLITAYLASLPVDVRKGEPRYAAG